MEKLMSVCELAKNLGLAFQMASIDPGKDTVTTAVDKFNALGARHLILYIENGGLLCLCSDPEMSRRLKDAIHRIDAELDELEGRALPVIFEGGERKHDQKRND